MQYYRLSLAVLMVALLSVGTVSALNWNVQTVDSAEEVGWGSSLPLDGNGNPWISYCDWTNKDLKYATGLTPEPKPSFYADFLVSPTNGTAPLTVRCTDKSTGSPTRFNYDFCDGTYVSGPNPVHTYKRPGVYTITLTIMKFDTKTVTMICSRTSKPGVVMVHGVPVTPPVAAFSASPVSGTAPLMVRFNDQSAGNPTFYTYDFGDGVNMTGPDPVHTYRYPGVYNVTMTILKPDPGTGSMVSSVSVKKGLIVVEGKPGTPLPATIKQVDHLMVQLPDPERVYNLFSGELGLPVAWPMVNYGPFSTGGVSFGNVNMELLNGSDEMKQQGLIPKDNGIVGVAFQPLEPLGLTEKTLDAHQIPHSDIIPFNVTENGTPSTLWSNLTLSEIMPGSMIFYC